VGEAYGEIVFNTAMCGYQEILTDPSYTGQIVTFTYPLIGNYGIQEGASESHRAFAGGVVMREASRAPSPWQAEMRLGEFLEEQGVVGIEEVDTRALTRHIRERGELKAVISTVDLEPGNLVEKARNSEGLSGRDLANQVSCSELYSFDSAGERGTVVVYDFGVKRGILRALTARGFRVLVVPARTPAAAVLAHEPVGILLSNGPGDPAAVKIATDTVRQLLGKLPILGICLGHQIAALALGAKTHKLKFGHHGANHPVQEIATGRVAITSQNHGFVVDDETLPGNAVVTHRSLNDGALEGFAVPALDLECVQFHPEASPGPLDSEEIFDSFARRCDERGGVLTRRGGD
jgi:carbamoyl-phosphate synthase small subunit